MLGVISDGQADLTDPAVKLMEVNAEAAAARRRSADHRPELPRPASCPPGW